MPKEIERKFLILNETWREGAQGVSYRQGYLCRDKERVVRLRAAGDKAFLTVKGLTVGASRAEYEYEIPLADCLVMLDTLAEKPLIEKTRYRIPYAGLIWEVDEFFGENSGLIVAEVELEQEDQTLAKPPWIGEEVTGDPRYYNSNLMVLPFSRWGK